MKNDMGWNVIWQHVGDVWPNEKRPTSRYKRFVWNKMKGLTFASLTFLHRYRYQDTYSALLQNIFYDEFFPEYFELIQRTVFLESNCFGREM